MKLFELVNAVTEAMNSDADIMDTEIWLFAPGEASAGIMDFEVPANKAYFIAGQFIIEGDHA